MYSFDFTDSSSDKNQSSSKETYVIDCDDSDASDKTFQSNTLQGSTELKDKAATQIIMKETQFIQNTKRKKSCVSPKRCSIISQEIYTQTSKTIFELAQNEKVIASNAEGLNSLETQTSFLSITENKTLEYHIQLIGDKALFNPHQLLTNAIPCNPVNEALANSLEDRSSFYQESDNEIEINKTNLNGDSEDKLIKFVDYELQDIASEDHNLIQNENTSEFETSKCDTDMEQDSLENVYPSETDQDMSITSEMPKSVDNDIEDLYNKFTGCDDVSFHEDENVEPEIPVPVYVGILTPLTEETNVRKASITDISPSEETLTKNEDTKSQITKSKSTGNPIKCKEDQSNFKLPPINNFSCPNSPLNFLFATASNKLIKTNNLPLVSENRKERTRWNIDANASGENPLININIGNTSFCN